MPEAHGYLKALLGNLRHLRENAGLTAKELEEQLILGPGWIERFEHGETVPSIDMILAILHTTNSVFAELLKGLPDLEASSIQRSIFAEQIENNVRIHFEYSKHDEQYLLPNSTLDEFGRVVKVLRDGLARLTSAGGNQIGAVKSNAVAEAFLMAVQVWPHANPSDLWGFVVSRAFCDPYNHPAEFARLDLEQSWKRTSGWALEEILVRHYGEFLKSRGVNLLIAKGNQKRAIVEGLRSSVKGRVEADKIDVLLRAISQIVYS